MVLYSIEKTKHTTTTGVIGITVYHVFPFQHMCGAFFPAPIFLYSFSVFVRSCRQRVCCCASSTF